MLDPLLNHAENLDRYTELRSHANLQTRLVMRKGVLIENTQIEKRGVSARCYRGGAFGFASRVGDKDSAIEAVIAEASANAELSRHGGEDRGVLPETAAGRGEFDYRTRRTRASAADRMAVVAAIDDYVTRTYPGLLNADIVLSNLAIEKALVTSEGAATRSYVPRSNVVLQLAVQGNDGVVDLHQVYGGFGDFEDRFESVDWMFEAVDRLYEELRAKADGAYCEAGTHDVILDSDLAGILAHEAIGHTCEADLVLGGSVAGDNLGRRVASEKFTLVDHAERGPDGNASIAIHVDDEGTPCRDVTIIENGVLEGFLHSKETALGVRGGADRQRPRLYLQRRTAGAHAQHRHQARHRQARGHDRRHRPRLLPQTLHQRSGGLHQRIHVRGDPGLRDPQRGAGGERSATPPSPGWPSTCSRRLRTSATTSLGHAAGCAARSSSSRSGWEVRRSSAGSIWEGDSRWALPPMRTASISRPR